MLRPELKLEARLALLEAAPDPGVSALQKIRTKIDEKISFCMRKERNFWK